MCVYVCYWGGRKEEKSGKERGQECVGPKRLDPEGRRKFEQVLSDTTEINI